MEQTVLYGQPMAPSFANNLTWTLTSLCQTSWGPFDDDFQLTSCFIDGVLYGSINLFLLIFGSYQVYSLSKNPLLSSSIDWHFWLKLVCIKTIYHYF